MTVEERPTVEVRPEVPNSNTEVSAGREISAFTISDKGIHIVNRMLTTESHICLSNLSLQREVVAAPIGTEPQQTTTRLKTAYHVTNLNS